MLVLLHGGINLSRCSLSLHSGLDSGHDQDLRHLCLGLDMDLILLLLQLFMLVILLNG